MSTPLDEREAHELEAARARLEAGDVIGLADACFTALGAAALREHPDWLTAENIAATGGLAGLLPADAAKVPIPAWALVACIHLIGAAVHHAPELTGRLGRHARPVRAAADRINDRNRSFLVDAGLRAGLSDRAARQTASKMLTGTRAAGTPRVMGQAWQRVQRRRPGWSFADGFFFGGESDGK